MPYRELSSDSAATPPRLRVFISYSRADGVFVTRLSQALESVGYVVDFDRSPRNTGDVDAGISAEDEWWQRLQVMIAAADVMVFAVSALTRQAHASGDEEIAYARSLSKRVIPLLWRDIDFRVAPPRLAALNVKISFANLDEFDAALNSLVQALDRDVVWLREQTRLTVAATAWERSAQRDPISSCADRCSATR